MSDKFGELVKAKLAELRISQRRLAMLSQSSPTYINYLVRGLNPKAKSRKLQPSVEMVKRIAKVLSIPPEEAVAAAGYDPAIALSPAFDQSGQVYVDSAVHNTPKSIKEDPLFDIACRAAQKAIDEHMRAPVKIANPLTIDIPGQMRIVLLEVTDQIATVKIEEYKQAFIAAYESVAEALTK